MNTIVEDAFNKEMKLSLSNYEKKEFQQAFRHLERAHILGQRNAIAHIKVHLWMLLIGIKTRSIKEVLGQLLRIPSGFLGSIIGVLPAGNTGGSNVPMMKSMDIPYDLAEILNLDD